MSEAYPQNVNCHWMLALVKKSISVAKHSLKGPRNPNYSDAIVSYTTKRPVVHEGSVTGWWSKRM